MMTTTNKPSRITNMVNYCQKHLSVRECSQTRTAILSIAAIIAIILVYQCGLLEDANALTRYFNCTTRAANKNGTLSLQNVDNCYDSIFKGAKQAEKELQMLRLETVVK